MRFTGCQENARWSHFAAAFEYVGGAQPFGQTSKERTTSGQLERAPARFAKVRLGKNTNTFGCHGKIFTEDKHTSLFYRYLVWRADCRCVRTTLR